jgi:hypothetical protein
MSKTAKSSTIPWLAKAIRQATKSARFCVTGGLGATDPGIELAGVGPVSVPLRRGMKRSLIHLCRIAPYGKGTETLVDTNVRNTFELDPTKFRLSDAWNAAVASATSTIAQQLGLPTEQLEAKLYKLLVYERGGFFLPHRDSEKHDRMVASMIVVLPNPFEGGALVVRHGSAEQKFTFDEAAAGKAVCYAAFFADCEHEVERVTRGTRICLAYNLVLKPNHVRSRDALKSPAPADQLADTISSWVTTQPGKPLVFALEHHYTQRGLSLDLLKGADRHLAQLVVPAAENANCMVHLSQVSRHLLQFADDGSFARGYRRGYQARRGPIEIGEAYEDDLSGTEWTDLRGKKQRWGAIPFDLAAIVSAVPIDDWKPTSEEFEGYTGNAGNTLDRWYHRSAIVVWHRDHHFDVIASSGAVDCIPMFCSMAAKLAKAKHPGESRHDCVRFARAIIERWPQCPFARDPSEKNPLWEEFQEHVLLLHDRETIAMFLSVAAARDVTLKLDKFIVKACHEFGWGAFADELTRLVVAQPQKHGPMQMPVRDIEWLSAYCCDKTADPGKSALAGKLCAAAVGRFCDQRPARPSHYPWHGQRGASEKESSLPLLVKALVASARDEDLLRVIRFVRESPDEFRLDKCQVPALKSLIPWALKRVGSLHPHLASWLDAVREELQLAIAEKPQPPSDWARPANVKCNCRYCAQLNNFLADPTSELGRIPAREDARYHLVDMIRGHQCDVEHKLERTGSPYSLVLKKTTGSFKRAVERFEINCRLLAELAQVPAS